jgi:biopolymer transport protein ExbD
MITRPLDLASKLRREPGGSEWLFLVNGALIVLFFGFFSSKFVLAPALGVDFHLPAMAGANADAQPATHYLSVTDSGQIFVRDGLLRVDQLAGWLRERMAEVRSQKHPPEPVLLVQASAGVPMQISARIVGAAREAGFKVRLALEEPKSGGNAGPPVR